MYKISSNNYSGTFGAFALGPVTNKQQTKKKKVYYINESIGTFNQKLSWASKLVNQELNESQSQQLDLILPTYFCEIEGTLISPFPHTSHDYNWDDLAQPCTIYSSRNRQITLDKLHSFLEGIYIIKIIFSENFNFMFNLIKI